MSETLREKNPENRVEANILNLAEQASGLENSFEGEIARKVKTIFEIKQQTMSMLDYADDPAVFQELKKLGIFVVRPSIAAFDFSDKTAGFNLQQGDDYLELHLPPVPDYRRSRGAAVQSFDLIGQYIREHNLKPKYIMGITYERLALFAHRRFGFNITQPPLNNLPEGLVSGVRRVYDEFTEAGNSGIEFGQPTIIFRDTEEFLSDFYNKDAPPTTVYQKLGRFVCDTPVT